MDKEQFIKIFVKYELKSMPDDSYRPGQKFTHDIINEAEWLNYYNSSRVRPKWAPDDAYEAMLFYYNSSKEEQIELSKSAGTARWEATSKLWQQRRESAKKLSDKKDARGEEFRKILKPGDIVEVEKKGGRHKEDNLMEITDMENNSMWFVGRYLHRNYETKELERTANMTEKLYKFIVKKVDAIL